MRDWDYREAAIHKINNVAECSMRLQRTESPLFVERVYTNTGEEIGAWVDVQIFVEKP